MSETLVDPFVIAATRGGSSHMIAELARGLRQGLAPSAALGELLHHPRLGVATLAHRLGRHLSADGSLATALRGARPDFPAALSRAADLEQQAECPGVLLSELAPTVNPPGRSSDTLTVLIHLLELTYLVHLALWIVAGQGFMAIFADLGADLPLPTVLSIEIGQLVLLLLPVMLAFSVGWRLTAWLTRERLPEKLAQSLPAGKRHARRRFCAALVGIRAIGCAIDDVDAASQAAQLVGPGLWTRGLERRRARRPTRRRPSRRSRTSLVPPASCSATRRTSVR